MSKGEEAGGGFGKSSGGAPGWRVLGVGHAKFVLTVWDSAFKQLGHAVAIGM